MQLAKTWLKKKTEFKFQPTFQPAGIHCSKRFFDADCIKDFITRDGINGLETCLVRLQQRPRSWAAKFSMGVNDLLTSIADRINRINWCGRRIVSHVSAGYYPVFGFGDTVTSEAKNSLNFFLNFFWTKSQDIKCILNKYKGF